MNLLAITLLLPLVGFFIASVSAPQIRRSSSSVALVDHRSRLSCFSRLIGSCGGQPGQQFTSIVDRVGSTARTSDSLSPRRRRHQPLAVTAHHVLSPIGVWISGRMIQERQRNFFALLLLFEFGLIGVFSALDLFLFYVFWEVALVPMYLMVGSWGGTSAALCCGQVFRLHDGRLGADARRPSSICTAGPAPSITSQILNALSQAGCILSPAEQLLSVPRLLRRVRGQGADLPAAYLAAGCVRRGAHCRPRFCWPPSCRRWAHMGCFAICLPLFPNAAHSAARWIAVLAIIGIIYGALLALVQPNIKRLVAYSSVSHLGFVVLGIFSFTQQGADGAVYQMIAHGISTGALFMLAGLSDQRRGSLEISDFGGVATPAPGLATAFHDRDARQHRAARRSCNFVGEFLVLQGAALAKFSWAAWAAIGVILSAATCSGCISEHFSGRPMIDTPRFPTLRCATGFLCSR